MNHKKILDELAFDQFAVPLDQEIVHLTSIGMAWYKEDLVKKNEYIITSLMLRWGCLSQHHSPNSREIVTFNIMFAIILHKYGIQHKPITDDAIKSIDDCNDKGIMPDFFYHNKSAIKEFLLEPAKELKRAPKQTFIQTYYRPKDVVSFEFEGKYIVAHIHDCSSGVPLLEFCDSIFDKIPTIDKLIGGRAYGTSYPESDSPNIRYAEKYRISRMYYLPDPAEQITLIASSVDLGLDRSGLTERMSIGAVIDFHEIPEIFEDIAGRRHISHDV